MLRPTHYELLWCYRIKRRQVVSSVFCLYLEPIVFEQLIQLLWKIYPHVKFLNKLLFPTREIIEELEPSRRGPYAGAVGHFSYNGNCDFAITIRTLVAQGDKAYIQVGAGIVADSDPEKEWYETEHKGKALMRALAQAGEKL